jgi:hypothetical protein
MLKVLPSVDRLASEVSRVSKALEICIVIQ